MIVLSRGGFSHCLGTDKTIAHTNRQYLKARNVHGGWIYL